MKIKIFFEHLPLSLISGLIGFYFYSDVQIILFSIIFGWLVDLDHLIDYLYGILKNNYKHSFNLILTGRYFKLNNKNFLIFHKIELVFLFFLVSFFNSNVNLFFSTMSLFLHILQDSYQHNLSIKFYSLFFKK